VSTAAVRLYYRASRDGGSVPATGPVLLVANHPNSLLDPAFLAWVSERPVRFLAKAPLLKDPLVGWLIRGGGSIPIYRRSDDPGQMSRNDETFRAVYDALAEGAAVAVFPEGTTHSEPSLVALKTGAARIALGAVSTVGGVFPIIPVGLVFREKDRFRSEAHAVVGEPVEWDDLAARPQDDRSAVRELTERIERGLRAGTLNLARWEDEAVVRTAEAVWAVTRQADHSPAMRVSRLGMTTGVLAALRAGGDERWAELARDVREHARVLRALGMRPRDVQLDTGFSAAARWAKRKLTAVGVLQFVLAALVVILFWLPYRLTGFIAGRMTKGKDLISTYRVLGGALIFTVWICVLAVMLGSVVAWWVGVAAIVILPAIAVFGLYALERWRWTMSMVRRWFILRRRDPRISSLRERQLDLARRLDEALSAYQFE